MPIGQVLKKLGIYTLADAAKKLNIKSDTLLKQCQKGKRQALKVGNTWLIRLVEEETFQDWLDSQW